MCNEYQLILPFDEVIEEFDQTRDPLVFPEGLPNFGPTAGIRIGDPAPVIWAGAEGPEARMTPWAWKGPGGRPVFNFRSDGRDFSNSLRCVIPADGFFEFTDPERGYKRKTKWRFTLKGQTGFWIAGLIKDAAFTMLTTEPGSDIAPYHDRQIVLLPKGGAMDWLDLTRPSADLLRPAPAGSLRDTAATNGLPDTTLRSPLRTRCMREERTLI